MSARTPRLVCALIALGLPAYAVATGDGAREEFLSRSQAETQAIQGDTAHRAAVMRAEAARHDSIAAAQLPNPRLAVGLLNLPVDSFDFDQEPMTQLRLGLRQTFPRGDTLKLRGRGAGLRAGGAQYSAALRQREVRREAATAWLGAFLAQQQLGILRENRDLFVQLQQITTSLYAVGRKNQQDVLRADLELARLEQRMAEAREKAAVARARLGRWIGAAVAQRTLSAAGSLPDRLPEAALRQGLARHPLLGEAITGAALAQNAADLVRQEYEPQWGVELAYGYRDDASGMQRADFVSAVVSVDLPLFSTRATDARLAAARANRSAAQETLADRHRVLQGMLDTAFAQWRERGVQLDLYSQQLLPTAQSQRAAALGAYQSDVSDFGSLVQAQTSLLNLQLQSVQMDVAQRLALVELRYLADDELLAELETGDPQ